MEEFKLHLENNLLSKIQKAAESVGLSTNQMIVNVLEENFQGQVSFDYVAALTELVREAQSRPVGERFVLADLNAFSRLSVSTAEKGHVQPSTVRARLGRAFNRAVSQGQVPGIARDTMVRGGKTVLRFLSGTAVYNRKSEGGKTLKIMTLNVNRFSGMGERDDTEGLSFDQCPRAKEILEAVDKILSEDPENIVFLEEIPYMCSPIKEGNKWGLYRRFEEELNEKGYKIVEPVPSARSCTIAVVNKNSDWILEPRSTFMRDYQNRFVTVRHKRTGLLVLGLHAIAESTEPYRGYKPEEVKKFFEKLYKYAAAHVEENEKKEQVVILGDMNVHSEKPCVYYDIFHRIRTEAEKGGLGYIDRVPDGTETCFSTRKTTDHVLVSPALKEKATVKVYTKEELCLSDHAVIVVDIQV